MGGVSNKETWRYSNQGKYASLGHLFGKPTDKASLGSAGYRRKIRVINICLYKLRALIYLILNLAKHTLLLFNIFKVDGFRLKIRF